jgi:ATP-dependent DNA ligase
MRRETAACGAMAKALNRQEFVIVGWSGPEGPRPHLGALLLGYYADDGKLTYAGRVGTGMPVKVLADLWRRLDPLARKTSPLSIPPPRSKCGQSDRRCCLRKTGGCIPPF